MNTKESSNWQPSAFYSACLDNDLSRARATIKPFLLEQLDPQGDTVLHIASCRGYAELVEFLLRYRASRTIRNRQGLTAEQVVTKNEIKDLFQAKERTESDSNYFVATTTEIEWLDSYKNAYRISYENRELMKRWLVKVAFKKLIDELATEYIEKITFSSEGSKDEIKFLIETVAEWENPTGLISAYTSGGTGFCTILNHDLAEIGSDFRFLSTQNLFYSGYIDNEAPKGLGAHIFAAIVIHHPFFKGYYRSNIITYRGMSISKDEFSRYKIDDIVMTRSFLSTSSKPERAQLFIRTDDNGKQPVLCVYEIKNRQTGLDLKSLSIFPEEQEILIVPFAVFRIKQVEDVSMGSDAKNSLIKMIKLEECAWNVD